MTTPADLAERYIAMWNETAAGRRRALIAGLWAEDAIYVDPLMRDEGVAGIDAMVAGAQQKFPGLVFSLAGRAEAVADRMRLSWHLGPAGGDAIAGGTDFASIAGGRLAAMTGFIDFAPAGLAG
ncbi:nuclear transport factor 2 family protein [Ferrovibrio xuzhouensis]|uniref:Nuclear transport factor 2 family protein n=1 Tax=Ferrovibrio xuzhouensis TaxID=1576914 RepID=A0ABV7VGI7_9PROT